MMDPDYLLFARAVEAGSLSAAGRMLNISPAMMSKRISRLETRLGGRLIHRTTRRLALTKEGASLHSDIVAILEAIQHAEDRVTNRHRAISGPLRVSAPTSIGRLHIAPHVQRFLETHPKVDLELNLSDAYEGQDKIPALRLPAAELECAVVYAVRSLLTDEGTIMALPQVEAQAIVRRRYAAHALTAKMEKAGKAELREQLQWLGLAILVHPDRIEGTISQRLLVALLDKFPPEPQDDGIRLPLLIRTKIDRRGHNLKLILRSDKQQPPKANPTLVQLLCKAEAARAQLFADGEATSRDLKLERLARLAFLAPDIMSAIMEGRHPPALTRGA